MCRNAQKVYSLTKYIELEIIEAIEIYSKIPQIGNPSNKKLASLVFKRGSFYNK